MLRYLVMLAIAASATAEDVDWSQTAEEAARTLQEYIRFDTTVPPGDVRASADFLEGILETEGISVTRYSSASGKVNLYARLEGSGGAKPILLMHHMDVVPADASRWDVDPFGGERKDGHIWGRGAMDMKGTGTLHLYAFLTLHRQKIPLNRDIVLMAVADEEVGGELGARFMIENHYDEIDPEYVLDEGGFGSRDCCFLH